MAADAGSEGLGYSLYYEVKNPQELLCKRFRGLFSYVVATVDTFSLKARAPRPPDIENIAVKLFQI